MPAHKYLPFGDGSVHLAHGGPTSLPTEPPPLGSGAVSVLLHDAGGSAGTWERFAAALGEGQPWIAVDQPAHGRSGGVLGPADVGAWAAVVGDLVGWLARRRVVLVGWGLGGAAALHAARRGVPGVVGIVLVGTGARFDVPDGLAQVLRDVVRGRRPQHFGTEGFAKGTSLDVMKIAWAEQVRTDPRVWLQDLELLAACDVGSLAAGVATPALVVTGEADRFAAPAAAQKLAASMARARAEIVPDAGHQLPVERPEALAGLVRTFVGDLA